MGYFEGMVPRILILLTFLAIGSCKQARKLADVFVPPSPREVYARSFAENHTLYAKWGASFKAALRDSLQIHLPYYQVGRFSSQDFPVYGYSLFLSRGEKLVVSFSTEEDSVPLFVDVYPFRTTDSLAGEALLEEKRYGRLPVELEISETGKYRLLVQPGLRQEASYGLEIYTAPSLGFPVAGVADKAIQSFWGDSRAAGARLHQGVDIFAPRLTPVLAVTAGRVSYTGARGLGGKQVWLREGLFNKSFYYAHLDGIKVTAGSKVSRGDTLGFVGNTGNARTTAPHLHFGIYTGGGAIDPLPFIRRSTRERPELPVPVGKGWVAAERANVRLGPDTRFTKVRTLNHRDTVHIVGRTEDWYHTELKDQVQGYIHRSLIRELKREDLSQTGSR